MCVRQLASMRFVHAVVVACLACAGFAACGGSKEGSPDAPIDVPCATTGRYLPLASGNSWSYAVTDVGTGAKENKTQTVGAMEDVGGAKAGVMAYRLTTTKVGGMVTSWQQDTGDMVVRHREIDAAGSQMTDEVYLPSKLRIDETPAHTAVGAIWDVPYEEAVTESQTGITVRVTKSERWTVIAADEPVSVGAGSFCALKLRRTSMSGGGSKSDKTFWFARGVGKIREDGTEQIEVLTAYTVR